MNPFGDHNQYFGIYSTRNHEQQSHQSNQHQQQHHHHHNQHTLSSNHNDAFVIEGEDISWLEQSEWVKDFFEEETSKAGRGFRKPTIPETTTVNSGSFKRSKSSNYEKKKVSDALTYGPRFIAIFKAYCTECNKKIDVSRHLMVLCLEHLVDFIKWCRSSDAQVQRITELLFENDYLRPEVRNGIVMVLIYTFAAIKATILENSDMFLTLQDMEDGLGIANKYSLKIYNDPLNYLIFLKTSISALIDAGLLPENERMTQPGAKGKSVKATTVVQEEIDAYYKVSRIIIDFLVQRKLAEAKNIVQVITTHWQLRGKAIRNRRFLSALETISQPDLRDISQRDYAVVMQKLREEMANSGKGLIDPLPLTRYSSNDISSMKASEPERYTFNPSLDVLDGRLDGEEEEEEEDTSDNSRKRKRMRRNRDRNEDSDDDISNVTNPTINLTKGSGINSSYLSQPTSSSQPQRNPTYSEHILVPANSCEPNKNYLLPVQPTIPFTLPVLRFERVGLFEWDIKESRIFDIANFMQLVASFPEIHLYLLNEKKFRPALQAMKMLIDPVKLRNNARKPSTLGLYSLEDEFTRILAIISHWSRNDLQQFEYFLKDYEQYFRQQQVQRQQLEELSALRESSSTVNDLSLIQFWQQLDPTPSPLLETASSTNNQVPEDSIDNTVNTTVIAAVGYIGYEITIYLILVIRKNPELGILNDIWCKIFPTELLHACDEIFVQRKLGWKKDQKLQGMIIEASEEESKIEQEINTSPVTFGEILINFFPQLVSVAKKYLQNPQQAVATCSQSTTAAAYDILVKYYSIPSSHSSNPQQMEQLGTSSSSSSSTSDFIVPPMVQASYYQTIGTFHTPAAKVMAR